MARISKSERIEIWLDRVRRHSESTQTIAQFCDAEGVSAPSFYQWKRRLATTQAEKLETEIAPHKAKPTAFSELQIVGHAHPALLTLPGGIKLELGADPRIAATIIDRVMQHACPTAEPAAELATAKSKSC